MPARRRVATFLRKEKVLTAEADKAGTRIMRSGKRSADVRCLKCGGLNLQLIKIEEDNAWLFLNDAVRDRKELRFHRALFDKGRECGQFG